MPMPDYKSKIKTAVTNVVKPQLAPGHIPDPFFEYRTPEGATPPETKPDSVTRRFVTYEQMDAMSRDFTPEQRAGVDVEIELARQRRERRA